MRSWIQVGLICGLIICASAAVHLEGGNAESIGRYQIAVVDTQSFLIVFQTDTSTGKIWTLRAILKADGGQTPTWHELAAEGARK
jgi:hypothetical protein